MMQINSFRKALLLLFYVLFVRQQGHSQEDIKYPLNVLKIENKLDALFKDYNQKPGVAIGIVSGGKLLIQKEYGVANLDYQIPISKKTAFHVASVSKQFTALSILLLETEGQLSLDDDIRKFIPEMHDFGQVITLRHLLTHTSGLKDQWNLLRLAGWRLDDVISNNQVLRLLYNQETLNFNPNEEFMYSNSGYTLLAEVVSRVSKMPFSEFTQKYIFQPLQMNNTLFVDELGIVVENKALSYYNENGKFMEDMFNNTSVGATNLSTTMEDLAKWAINFTSKIAGNDSIFEIMNTLEPLNNGDTYGYAFGQFVNKYNGFIRIEHSGMDASYIAYLGRFPELDISIVFTSNNSSINAGEVIRVLTDMCLENYLQPVTEITKTQKSIPHKNPVSLKPHLLKYFEGYYWNGKDNYSRQIKVEYDTLTYMRSNGDKSKLIPVGTNEFEMEGDEYVCLTFTNDKMTLTFEDGYAFSLDKYVPANYNSTTLKEFTGIYYSSELTTYYELTVRNNMLVVSQTRLGEIALTAIKPDFFIGKGSIRELQFLRDKSNQLKGFVVSSSRAKNILFKKIISGT